jgi:hypothetical protein
VSERGDAGEAVSLSPASEQDCESRLYGTVTVALSPVVVMENAPAPAVA